MNELLDFSGNFLAELNFTRVTMPSTARRLKARLLQSANHSSEERWTVELSDLVVCGLPEHVKLVQFILQRRDNKKKMKATTVVETSMGEAKWTCRLQQPLTVYQSNGKTVPKYYELVVRGSETSEQKMEVVGRITVNISEYCTDTPARDHSPGKLSLKLKHAGSLKVILVSHLQCACSILRVRYRLPATSC